MSKVSIEGLTPSAELAQQLFPPTLIGPTWQKNSEGGWLLPEISMGWEILTWISTRLTNDDGGPWVATGEQARFLLWFYAVDKKGKFIYRKGFCQRLKGWGKDPLAAVMCLIELVGPSRFSHWVDEQGKRLTRYQTGARPVGRPHPAAYVQVTAVSLDQTENTLMCFQAMVPQRTREEYRLDIQKEIIYANGGRQKLKAVAASFRAAEGGRVSFAVLGEVHHWVPGKGADKFYRTLFNNITKVKGRFICITNAYEPGERSVAETIREEQEKVWAGTAKGTGWLYDSIEAHPDAPLTEDWAKFIVETIRGDAYWLDVDLIAQSIQDTSIPASTHRRMWFNQIVTTSDSLFDVGEWDACLRPGLRGTKDDLEPGDEIVMGFDGGKNDDASALVAIRIHDKLIVPLAIWQKDENDKDWSINPAEVETEIHQAFASYTIHAFYADVYPWESYVNGWSDIYRDQLLIKATPSKSAVGFDMRGNGERIARGHEALVAMVQDAKISHNGDKVLRIHVGNTKRARSRFGLTFRKDHPESPRKVDAWAATLLAFIALTDLAESGKKAKPVYSRRLHQF